MKANPVVRPTRPRLKPHEVVRCLLESYFLLREYSAREGRYVLSYQGYDFSYLDLDACFGLLTKRQRLAINLHICNGIEPSKVARMMGIQAHNVNELCEEGCKWIAKTYYPELMKA